VDLKGKKKDDYYDKKLGGKDERKVLKKDV
jgi:hypothetical protein